MARTKLKSVSSLQKSSSRLFVTTVDTNFDSTLMTIK